MSSSTSDTEKFDPARRRLCPDGSCVGLLDDAGRCKVCGLTASGDYDPGPSVTPLYDESDEAAEGADEPSDVVDATPDEPGTGAFNSKRRLCPDGACVGVIGADGRCKVCGQEG
jgi:hypothetical protein